MEEATAHLRALARRVVDAAAALGPLRAALLAGSAARGDADRYSDLDLLLYVDALPPASRLAELCESLGGSGLVHIAPPHTGQFRLDGVAVQVGYGTVAEFEAELDGALERLDAMLGTPNQKLLSGLLDAVPLHGEELVERWRGRAAVYPEALRLAMIEHHWRFFPLWYYDAALGLRDAELWRLDLLLDAAFDLLGVLAGLNRVYFARFELKRLRALVARFTLAPPDLAERLESLFRLPASASAAALGELVLETRALVRREFPALALPLARGLDERVEPWPLPGSAFERGAA